MDPPERKRLEDLWTEHWRNYGLERPYELSEQLDLLTQDTPADKVQEARIVLLDHHTSQMQAYKDYILTLVGILLGLVGILLQLVTGSVKAPTFQAMIAAFVTLGFISGAILYSVAKFAWYGQVVGAVSVAPMGKDSKALSLIGQLGEYIGKYTEKEIEGMARKGRAMAIWRRLFNLGACESELLGVCLSVWCAVVVIGSALAYLVLWPLGLSVVIIIAIALAVLFVGLTDC